MRSDYGRTRPGRPYATVIACIGDTRRVVSSKRSARLRPAVPPQRRDGHPIGGTGAVDLRKRPRVDLDKAPPAAVSLRKRPRVELRKRPKVSLVKVRPPAGRPPLRQRVRSAALSTREW